MHASWWLHQRHPPGPSQTAPWGGPWPFPDCIKMTMGHNFSSERSPQTSLHRLDQAFSFDSPVAVTTPELDSAIIVAESSSIPVPRRPRLPGTISTGKSKDKKNDANHPLMRHGET